MLVSMKSILDKAKDGGYAVAAPNVFDQHTVTACLQAAEEEKSPIIIDFAEPVGDITIFAKCTLPLMRDCAVPVAVNLDHGHSYEIAMKAIRAGFTSVMVDRSTLPYEENVKQVKEITRIAHISGVSVEAELGRLVQINQDAKDETLFLTDPEEAKRFVEETGIDCLAVAIGTSHGPYKGKPFLDIDRLAKVRDKVDVPLVLHGGSFTGDDNLRKAVKNGICKINLATDIFTSGVQALRAYLDENPNTNWDTWFKATAAATEGYKNALRRYMRLFDCTNKA